MRRGRFFRDILRLIPPNNHQNYYYGENVEDFSHPNLPIIRKYQKGFWFLAGTCPASIPKRLFAEVKRSVLNLGVEEACAVSARPVGGV